MVYRGKPSKGCKECRSRKIRCGQEIPECTQCVKAERQCSGYRDQLDLMFLDESSSVRIKAHAGEKPRKERPSPSQIILPVPGFNKADSSSKRVSPPLRLLNPPLQDQAVAFFFANYADVGPKNSGAAARFSSLIYHQDQPDGAVKTIVRALGLGGLSRLARDVRMRNAAISNYVSAMSKTNELLRNPQKAKEDTTLYAIIALAMFETITGCSPQSVAATAKHIRGIITLLELRGPHQLENEVGLAMYLRIRGHLIVACLEYYIPITPALLKWTEELEQHFPDLRPDNKLADFVVEFANLRSRVQDGTFKNPADVISDLLEIDKKLDTWDSSLPPSWKYTEYPVKAPTDDVLESTIVEYADIWTGSIFIKWRCIRIHVREFLLSFIAQCSQLKLILNAKSDTERQVQESRRIIQILTYEVAAGIPYMLGYRRGEKLPLGSNIPAVGGMLACWPLFAIGGTVAASDTVRAWSIRRLLSIGTDMGVYQGPTLAAVLRTRKEIAYWRERLAKEPIENLPAGDHSDVFCGEELFDEGSPEWMSRSDFDAMSGQFKKLRVSELGQD